jgi:hypothetical protein
MPILGGDFKDFSVEWYRQVGAVVCVTMAINVVSPHVKYVGLPMITFCRRACDRNCSRSLKREKSSMEKTDAGDLQDFSVNTKLEL